MPYILKKHRKKLIDLTKQIKSVQINTAGELNYIVTTLVLEYLKTNTECYQSMNDVMGALEGAKLELYRKKISVYEEEKEKQNGPL